MAHKLLAYVWFDLVCKSGITSKIIVLIVVQVHSTNPRGICGRWLSRSEIEAVVLFARERPIPGNYTWGGAYWDDLLPHICGCATSLSKGRGDGTGLLLGLGLGYLFDGPWPCRNTETPFQELEH